MKATINGITIECETAEVLADTINKLLGIAPKAVESKPVHVYKPTDETKSRLESFLAIGDKELANITRQVFTMTEKSERYKKFMFLKHINGKTEVKNLDVNALTDSIIADRIRECIKRQLETGSISTATNLLKNYGKTAIATLVKE